MPLCLFLPSCLDQLQSMHSFIPVLSVVDLFLIQPFFFFFYSVPLQDCSCFIQRNLLRHSLTMLLHLVFPTVHGFFDSRPSFFPSLLPASFRLQPIDNVPCASWQRRGGFSAVLHATPRPSCCVPLTFPSGARFQNLFARFR